MLPGLWKTLRQGGAGSATVIYPNLLPYLSHIPQDVIGDGTQFYTELFNNIKTGSVIKQMYFYLKTWRMPTLEI
jgi:hypothetical protein